MKIFITGVSGQLGYDIALEGIRREIEVYGTDLGENSLLEGTSYHSMDIRNLQEIEDLIQEIQPDVVFHAAAWTAVDDAEDKENVKAIFEINEKATGVIAKACKKIKAKMIYISTDYVFNGQGDLPWEVDSKDFSPLNKYGESKLAGEEAVQHFTDKAFIVRIAWVFGMNGKNFVKTMLRVGEKYDEVRVVSDQIGRPTYTEDLSKLLFEMAKTDKYGIYHATNEGDYISWYDFTCEIYRLADLKTKVTPVTTEEYGLSKAKRPFNSRLSTSKLQEKGFNPLPEWKDALERYINKINNSGGSHGTN